MISSYKNNSGENRLDSFWMPGNFTGGTGNKNHKSQYNVVYAVFYRNHIFEPIDLKICVNIAQSLYIMRTSSGPNRFVSFWFLNDLPIDLENRRKKK